MTHSATTAPPEPDEDRVNTPRFLAVDMVQKANSGHPGLPLDSAAVPYAFRDKLTELAGEKIHIVLTQAAGSGAPIGVLKVIAESGWFAVHPSGTDNMYEIYAESFRGAGHLRRIIEEAHALVSKALAAGDGATIRLGIGNINRETS